MKAFANPSNDNGERVSIMNDVEYSYFGYSASAQLILVVSYESPATTSFYRTAFIHYLNPALSAPVPASPAGPLLQCFAFLLLT